jgi:4a-hydroxytetrahydrobiopterin dehydratase
MGHMSELLDQAAIDDALTRLDDWSGGPAGISRTAELPSFPAAIGVVDRVAEAAEAADHHPDIDIRWRTLTFACATHSAGGVTAKDIDLAGRIDEIVRAATS